jgi:predicted RNA-binding protein YlxR (DUF448 family)
MNNPKGHIPVRTCVSCRSKKAKKELVRLVLDKDNRVIIDRFRKKEGRGIYLCNNESCMAGFLKNKRPGRFFRTDKAVTIGFKVTEDN